MAGVDLAAVRERLKVSGRDPRMVARVGLALLTVANLIAAVIVLKPWSGSAEELEREAATLRQTLERKRTSLDKLRGIVNKVESARSDGDKFMDSYLLRRRWVSSRLLLDLDHMARQSGIRQKEVAFAFEPVEGSDTLTKATVTANYEGPYASLIQFLNLVDRGQRLLIIESLAATPQPQGPLLNITMKFNAFVREGGNAPAELTDAEVAAAPPEAMPVAMPVMSRPRVPMRAAPISDPGPGSQPGAQHAPPAVPVFRPQPANPVQLPMAGPRVLRERLRPPRAPETEGRQE
jgi:Tfp pilus assembly protein PilO